MADESRTEEPQLTVQRDGNVVVLTMNNPRRKNALTPAMITLMAQAWDEIDADDGIRAAILTGEGSSYCVGVTSPMGGWSAVPRAVMGRLLYRKGSRPAAPSVRVCCLVVP